MLAISKRWVTPEADYRKWHRERAHNDFALGTIRIVQVSPQIHIANMIGQHGMKTGSNGPPIRYEAVAQCLARLTESAQELGASVHMPRIGCGLAGGKWNRIEPLILDTLVKQGVATYLYDFE